jgi:hypothetical protein
MKRDLGATVVPPPPSSEPDWRISRIRLVVLPSRGLADRIMGVLQAEQSTFVRAGVRPSCVPSVALNPLCEGRQHPCLPNRRFGLGQAVPCLSGCFTRKPRLRDCHRWCSFRLDLALIQFLWGQARPDDRERPCPVDLEALERSHGTP